MVFRFTNMGKIMPEIPKIPSRLTLLLPIIFPNTISSLAWTFTANSGAEVPKATTVNPIAISETLYFLAKLLAPSTSQSAPLITATKPIIRSRM